MEDDFQILFILGSNRRPELIPAAGYYLVRARWVRVKI